MSADQLSLNDKITESIVIIPEGKAKVFGLVKLAKNRLLKLLSMN